MDSREVKYYQSLGKVNEALEKASFKLYGQEPPEGPTPDENTAPEDGGIAPETENPDKGPKKKRWGKGGKKFSQMTSFLSSSRRKDDRTDHKQTADGSPAEGSRQKRRSLLPTF